MTEILIAAAQTVVVSTVIFYLQRKQKTRDENTDKRAASRKRESLLSLEMNKASADLSYAVAMAIKRGTPNGEIEQAVTSYESAKNKYYDFINEQAAEHLQ